MSEIDTPETTVAIYDHVKVNIEQTAKGARVTVTYDRSDHDIYEATDMAVRTYALAIEKLKKEGLKVDES